MIVSKNSSRQNIRFKFNRRSELPDMDCLKFVWIWYDKEREREERESFCLLWKETDLICWSSIDDGWNPLRLSNEGLLLKEANMFHLQNEGDKHLLPWLKQKIACNHFETYASIGKNVVSVPCSQIIHPATSIPNTRPCKTSTTTDFPAVQNSKSRRATQGRITTTRK